MTKYILHGGMLKYANELNSSFFREFTKGLNDGDMVLHIGFARENSEERRLTSERDKSLILAETDKKLNIVFATLETLEDQLQNAKAVFVTGGNTEVLIADISSVGNFTQLLEGKVYAGSSAGAYLVSRYYFSGGKQGVREGLGQLAIRILAHYGDPEYDPDGKAGELLQALPEDTELILLKECEWVVREK